MTESAPELLPQGPLRRLTARVAQSLPEAERVDQHPSLRARCRAAEAVLTSGRLEALPSLWESEWKGELEAEIGRRLAIDLGALDDGELLGELDSLLHLLGRGAHTHLRLFIPFAVGVSELVQGCRELLGWDTARTLDLLSGLSPASSGPARALDELAHVLLGNPAAVEAVRRGDLHRVEEVAPSVHEALERYRRDWGWRPTNYDPGSPALAERPDLLARHVLDRLEARWRAADLASVREARILEARAALGEGAKREQFEALLRTASRVYPLREDNVRLTDNLPSGLLRRWLLEVGRRLVERGALAAAADASWLRGGELREALLGRPAPTLRRSAARRRAEHDWMRAHPGPEVLGPSPTRKPDVRGLPTGARRLSGAVFWVMDQEAGSSPSREGRGVSGVPACAGRHSGHVRIVMGERDFGRLGPGDVLVCPTTTPGWTPLFAVAGALVTDAGGLLSHTAIVAREHGLPTVLATRNATRELTEGELVTVDGDRGTVEVAQPRWA